MNRSNNASINESTISLTVFHGSRTKRVLVIVLTTVLMLLTLLVNSFVCSALIKGKHSIKGTKVFIINLCVANMLVAVFSMPWWMLIQINEQHVEHIIKILGKSLMDFLVVTDILSGIASILTLTAISVVRWLTVIKPLDYKTILTTRRCMATLSAIWIYATGVASLKLIHWSEVHGYSMFVVVFGFALPFAVLGFAYGKMLLIAKSYRRSNPRVLLYCCKSENVQHISSLEWENGLRRNLKGCRTMAIVTGTFLICWLPFFVISICYAFIRGMATDLTTALAAKWLGYCNAPLSPIVYTILDQRLRKSALNLLCYLSDLCCLRKK